MKITGIIAEYDPFHRGHAYQLAQIRRLGAEKIIVCMSGDIVQRGSFAVLPSHRRAEAALRNGADMVVLLPGPWACASAEGFAAAAVSLLSALGCDTLAFGAEAPDTDRLKELSCILDNPSFPTLLREELETGIDFATARSRAVKKMDPVLAQLLNQPNNLLGVEYCKAIRRQHSSMQPLAMARRGANHGQEHELGQIFASSSAVRKLWQQGNMKRSFDLLPENTWEQVGKAFANGEDIDAIRMETAILSRLRGMTVKEMAGIRGVNEGLENRLSECVRCSSGLAELYDMLKTRRYAHSRMRRMVMDAVLGYGNELPPLPPFVLVLGAKKKTMGLLGECTIPAGTSLAVLEKQNRVCAAAAHAHAASVDLAALCRRKPGPMGLAYTEKPVLL